MGCDPLTEHYLGMCSLAKTNFVLNEKSVSKVGYLGYVLTWNLSGNVLVPHWLGDQNVASSYTRTFGYQGCGLGSPLMCNGGRALVGLEFCFQGTHTRALRHLDLGLGFGFGFGLKC